MKKRIILLMVLLLSALFCVPSFAVEKNVDTSQKVYDYAQLLSDEQEATLKAKCVEFIDAYQNDVVILTISENDKKSALEYGQDFYDYNGFGVNGNQGILLIIDMQNRIAQAITTGKEFPTSAFRIIDPNRLSVMEENVTGYLKTQDYFGGTMSFVEQTNYYMSLGADVGFWENGGNAAADAAGGRLSFKERFLSSLGIGAIIGCVVTSIVLLILLRKNRQMVLATNAVNYVIPESLEIQKSSERLISTNTTKVPLAQDDSRGGSGGSGGGFSVGSSGTSHGSGGGSSF